MGTELLVTNDGDVRIVTLNRPDRLNGVSAELHQRLSEVWGELAADPDARAVVLTGAGRAFSAGGDIAHLERHHQDQELRERSIDLDRTIQRELMNFPLPIIAAVNGPAVGLGCSLVALSDIVYLGETAFLADPHVQIGLVAADGGPLTWPLQTSLLVAKEYALTGARIPAARAVALGLANHVVADPLGAAVACATRIAGLPRQAVESTKRLLNLHLERAVLATLDYANTAEEQSFDTEDFRAALAALSARGSGPKS
jgi:enoyl-CoA hydratase/carnithine racemase